MTDLIFEVPGEPRGASRHRHRLGGRGGYNSKPHEAALGAVMLSARRAMASNAIEEIAGPIELSILALHPRPRRLCTRAARALELVPFVSKPDADNVAKLVMDGCTRAGAWRDDSQVVSLHVHQVYARWVSDGPEPPRVIVRVTELRPDNLNERLHGLISEIMGSCGRGEHPGLSARRRTGPTTPR